MKRFIKKIDGLDNWTFRGQTKKEWDLLPKLGRPEYYPDILLSALQEVIQIAEKKILDDFRLRLASHGIEFGQPYSRNNPTFRYSWIPMIIGQHYGLPTRLLDFTFNPLVAIYFAINKHSDTDGVVWCLPPGLDIYNQFEIYENKNPIQPSHKDYYLIVPANIDNRIPVQSSVFLYFGQPHQELLGIKNIKKFIIPNNSKVEILKDLNKLGVNRESLFLDLSNICENIIWKLKNSLLIKYDFPSKHDRLTYNDLKPEIYKTKTNK